MSSHLNDPRHPWVRLTAAARTVRDDRDTAAPYGFSTRVAAMAMVQESRLSPLFDMFALRALGVASLLALFSIAMNYSEITAGAGQPIASTEEFVMPATDDALAVVLDLAD